MKRVAVIGGGIAGLSAAFELDQRRRRGVPLEYLLVEGSARLGGALRTEHVNGWQVEAGADSFLTEKPWAAELCRDLGLAEQLLSSNDVARKTFVLVSGRPVPIPDGLQFIAPTRVLPALRSPLFSLATKLRFLTEWFEPPRAPGDDESVSTFVRRHFGNEMVDRLADPLLAGIFGGRAAQLSVRAVLPRFAELEATYGSLVRGLRRSIGARRGVALFTTLREGMQQMPDKLALRLMPTGVCTSTRAVDLQRRGEQWVLTTSSGTEYFDAAVVALPAYAVAALLSAAYPGLASKLSEIQYTSSLVVALGYDTDPLPRSMRAFGMLTPAKEGLRMLACTFVHHKFPHRVPQGKGLLRVVFGGARDESAMSLSESEAGELAASELKRALQVDAEPSFVRVYRWPRAMPQYDVGHLERVAQIEGLAAQLPGLVLAGSAYRGIGVPDCVRSGRLAAERALA